MEPKPIDSNAFKKGTIPWSTDECIEVMEWYHHLNEKPKDDWDLTERGLYLEHDESDKIMQIRFNQFMPINQLGFYMAKRYSSDVMPYHLNRFMHIMDFLSKYHEQLKLDGLSRTGGEDHDEICVPVLEALCELPFSKRIIIKGEERYEFEYREVVQRAQELLDEYHEGEDQDCP